MNDVVKTVGTKVIIHFSNGESYELPLKGNEYTDLKTYGNNISIDEKLYTSNANNIVGNICGNTMSIKLVSNDKLLIPSNEESIYYGYMDDTSYIEVFTYIDNDEANKENMGIYFVDTWESGLTSKTANEVTISCIDIIAKIKNIALTNLRVRRNISFEQYISEIIDKINSILPEYMHIKYSLDDINIYKNSKYEWQMQFNNIERSTVETLFNDIAQYTISYIWINRDMTLKTDHLLDDNIAETVSELSGSTNLLEYGLQSGDIDKYSGVKVQYINSISYEDKQLLQISDVELTKGQNILASRKMNSNNVFSVELIEIECVDGNAICVSFDYYKDSINMIIESSNKTVATIRVYGKTINEEYSTIERYKNENNKGSVIEIQNRVLRKELIETYTDGLINIMNMKNNKAYATGFISPKVRLGDTVHLIGSRCNIDDYYKVIGLKYTLGNNYRCTASLIKVIETPVNVDDILYSQIKVLYDRLTGLEVNTEDIEDITVKENEICEQVLAEQLAILR